MLTGLLAAAIELTEAFAALVRHRRPEQLDAWLTQAATCSLAPFRHFAKRLWVDYDAVKAGVTVAWSNGTVEGHINRLKMIKRSMFGRAKLDELIVDVRSMPREIQQLAYEKG